MDSFRIAAEEGLYGTLQKLIVDGYDVNSKGGKGKTPLMKAACFGEYKAVKSLIAFGAIVDQRDEDGNTALFWGIIGKTADEKLLEHLVISGANVNIFDNEGISPLIYTVATGDSANVQFLLSNGADPNIANKHGKTAVDAANVNGKQTYLEWFEIFAPKASL